MKTSFLIFPVFVSLLIHCVLSLSDRCILTQPIPLHMNISAVNITWSYDGPPGAQFIVQAKIGGQPCCSNITQLLSISYYIYNKLLLSQFYQFQVLAIVEGVACNTSALSLVFISGASGSQSHTHTHTHTHTNWPWTAQNGSCVAL